jgi:hypothetical protein
VSLLRRRPARGLTELLADPGWQGSLSGRMRSRRWDAVAREFPELGRMRVLDLGGEIASWLLAPIRPAHLVSLNVPWQADLERQQLESLAGTTDVSWIELVGGDACNAPAQLSGERFDLVYSNSVIEHLGGHERRARFAAVVSELAERHWIQTPDRYFPLEPHWLFPGFQFLPVRVRAELTRVWPFGHLHADSLSNAMREVLAVELLSPAEMRFYFPFSQLRRERVLGLTKSLVAVR